MGVNTISGRKLIDLLTRDGWQATGRSRHGTYLLKKFPGETVPRKTVVPDKTEDLPDGTLGAILGVEQTRLGKRGLQQLLKKYNRK